MKFLVDQQGSALIEFVLALPLFMLVFVGFVDIDIYIHSQSELTEAAAAGAAFGAIPGNQKNLTGMQAAATRAAPDVANLTVVASDIYTCTPGGPAVTNTSTCSPNAGTPLMYVQVKTSATVPALLHWTGLSSSLNLGATSLYRVPWTQ